MKTATVTVHLLVECDDEASVTDTIHAMFEPYDQRYGGAEMPLIDWSYALSERTGEPLVFPWDYNAAEYGEGDFMARLPANQQCRGEATQ